jgi:hypothetical protein
MHGGRADTHVLPSCWYQIGTGQQIRQGSYECVRCTALNNKVLDPT